MDYSAANTSLWNFVTQFGIIAIAVIVANTMRRKIVFFRKSLMPTAVLAGFLLLLCESLGILHLDSNMLEMITYHGIAIGFIAMTLRVNKEKPEDKIDAAIGAKSGALIVSTYLVQALLGIIISVTLALTLMPGLFKASGVLLPMGYGQGPGQANNIGGTYEQLGFAGGRSFGLSLAASGYLVACIFGVIAINVLQRKGKLTRISHGDIKGSVSIDVFQDENEIPLSESLDRLSMQVALILIIYFVTYLITKGVTGLITAISPSAGQTVNSLLWGFNFIIASLVTLFAKWFMGRLKKIKFMSRQYQNNYLLNRISGFAFDVMIIAGIASIRINDLKGLWIPFIALSIAGAFGTWYYLSTMCKKIYPGYYYEGLLSMFGMLTGTISSGILLLREIDPDYETPAANNLVFGSTFGIGFGFPVLIFVGIAPKSDILLLVTFIAAAVYLAALVWFILRKKKG